MSRILQMNSRPISSDNAKLVRYIRDMGREMAKMTNSASLDLLAYLLSLVVGGRDSQRLRTGSRSRGTSPARLSAATSPIYLSIATVAQLPQVSRVFSGNGTAMSEMQDDQNTKSKFAVKHEESLELLKAFLMIEDPKLRADIISMVKQTARVQPKR